MVTSISVPPATTKSLPPLLTMAPLSRPPAETVALPPLRMLTPRSVPPEWTISLPLTKTLLAKPPDRMSRRPPENTPTLTAVPSASTLAVMPLVTWPL